MLAKQIVERRQVEIFHEASSRGQKKATPEQEDRVKELRRMAAALEALAGVAGLDDTDVAAGPGRVLADAAMAMLIDPEVKAMALTDIANHATRSDRPASWRFCMDHGFDPFDSDAIIASEGRWSRSESKPCAWIGKALSSESWEIAKMLAALPEGKAGVPAPRAQEPEEPVAAGAKPARKAKGKKALAMDTRSFQHWEAYHYADHWAANHPTLIEWQRAREGEKAFPAAVKKALRDHGFVPHFGEPAFDIAAADLAMRGSAPALAACMAAGLGPQTALAEDSLDEDEAQWNGRYPKLAKKGGLLREKEAVALWTPVAAWIDANMGADFSDKLVSCAALDILREWSHGKFREYDHQKGQAAKAIEWLTAKGPLDADRAVLELDQLQGMAIELAEADRGKPRSEQAALASLMTRWSEAAHGKAPTPRRVLKA